MSTYNTGLYNTGPFNGVTVSFTPVNGKGTFYIYVPITNSTASV
jgi:hypothetical protein